MMRSDVLVEEVEPLDLALQISIIITQIVLEAA
jgi:hypothetical protein